jgi:hypothetical protein
MITKVMEVGVATMPMLAFIFIITVGITGAMEILLDGVGTTGVTEVFIITDGTNLGAGTDGTIGDIQVSDSDTQDIEDLDLDGTDLIMVMDTGMATVIDITAETIVLLIEIMH